MRSIHPLPRPFALALVIALLVGAPRADAASFVYEGRLDERGQPANGRYDLRLHAFGHEALGAPIAAPVTVTGIEVRDGRFRTELQLPVASETVWLAVDVRSAGESTFSAIGGRSKAIAAPLVGQCWSTTGDVASDPAINFIGTTDAQPFVVRTQNVRSLRIEPSAVLFGGNPITANTIAGASANTVSTGVRGATIAGGGVVTGGDTDPNYPDERANRIFDHHGTIGGGYGNSAGSNPVGGTPLIDQPFATVAGGFGNRADGAYSSVGGGFENIAAGDRSTVAGGASNTAQAFATVGGGLDNRASGDYGAAGGGQDNASSGDWSAIAGGESNWALGQHSAITGGFDNRADAASSFVGGGASNFAGGAESVIAGGFDNASGGDQSVVGGGSSNSAGDTYSSVLGGSDNAASRIFSTVAGGSRNTASGRTSFVAGGFENCAGGTLSWAGGNRAKVRPGTDAGGSFTGCLGVPSGSGTSGDRGTFAWADSQSSSFVSTGEDQFLVRASGGIWLGTTSTVSIPSGRFLNTSTGGYLSSGGTWTNASSRALKTDFAAIDPGDVLARVLQLGLNTWVYRASDEGRHLGPIAEEFHALFGLGADDTAISTVDASGVALAAIQGLNAKLEADNQELRDRLERLEARFDRCPSD